jgi:predicted nucleic acid-binding protein
VTTLFDSSVLIDHLRGRPEATELLVARVSEGTALVSVVTRVEIEGGMRSDERHGIRRLFAALTVVPVTDEIAKAAATTLREFRRSHVGIDLIDYVIAATAMELGAELATLNLKHFPMFPNLRAPYRST